VETHSSYIRKVEGMKDIRMWLKRWMQKQDIMLKGKNRNKQNIEGVINPIQPSMSKQPCNGVCHSAGIIPKFILG